MIEVKNPETCTGCLICEMACSFHHSRIFSRARSSIRVNKSISNPEKWIKISIANNEEEKWNPLYNLCNNCNNEDYPFCVKFCPQNVYKFVRRVA